MKDFLGREIKVGDTVVYPVRRGSRLWMNRMTVVTTDADRLAGVNPEGRRVALGRIANVTVVQPPEVAD